MDTERGIAEEMRRVADAYPWLPIGTPPRRHYQTVGNLSICFTLDMLPHGRRLYHLSITRKGLLTPPSDEEAKAWCTAFFSDIEPFEFPSQLPGVPSRHFFWEIRQISLS